MAVACKQWLSTALAVVLGVALGVISAWLIAGMERWLGGVEVDGWRTNTLIANPDAGLYVRAVTARIGLFALARDEAIYYFRERDAGGRRFRPDCDYRLRVSDPRARWWSITLYDEDRYLARNDDDAHSVGSWDVDAGDEDIMITPSSAVASDRPRLSNRSAGAFSLILRLYDPDPQLVSQPVTLVAPEVERAGCHGETGT